MNSRPILFSAPMVNAILEGRKTQTRRVVDPQPKYGLKQGALDPHWYDTEYEDAAHTGNSIKCRYGQPGDRLWVKETFKCEELDPYGEYGVRYRADNAFVMIENTREASERWGDAYREGGQWRPSIFMPRWVSRIDLKIVNVRVERVQDISRDDAKAEGVSGVWVNPPANEDHYQRVMLNPYVANYSVLWDEINGERGFGWDVNPWVWVLEYKVLGNE